MRTSKAKKSSENGCRFDPGLRKEMIPLGKKMYDLVVGPTPPSVLRKASLNVALRLDELKFPREESALILEALGLKPYTRNKNHVRRYGL
jgi:hypothetical protein